MQAPQLLSAELQSDIDAHAADGFEMWRDNSTPEQKAIGSAEIARFVNDPEFAASEQKRMEDEFNKHSVAKPGVLSQPEFIAFVNVLMEDGAKKGNYEDPRPETVLKSFALADRITPDAEGVSLQDWFTLAFAQIGKTQELKTAAGLWSQIAEL